MGIFLAIVIGLGIVIGGVHQHQQEMQKPKQIKVVKRHKAATKTMHVNHVVVENLEKEG